MFAQATNKMNGGGGERDAATTTGSRGLLRENIYIYTIYCVFIESQMSSSRRRRRKFNRTVVDFFCLIRWRFCVAVAPPTELRRIVN